ncbi:DUF3224 domain-containing protein [Nonomuraea sp. MG754425]|uniref:DUF3224 domain-containing protein n=1 Tax=Nonomuraea sp. MG754425 TaxID=2570319 RepID=UPI001F20CBE3|nr:DUF3224 domain-containing protein [Nonomuraea sp. MG754425]MCF6469886.1 DUF3224 domain-containing protein [Nonomuraea sp. MG754425]
MPFTWGGLTEAPDGCAEARPPAGAVTHTSSVEVLTMARQDIGPQVEGGPAVFATLMTERFSGGIEGTGHADHVRVVQPDGSQIVAGVERVVATVDGRSGSFVLTSYGHADRPGTGQGYWTVVPGSGTGGLTGLRGRGEFTVALGPDGVWRAEDSFTHWFDQ